MKPIPAQLLAGQEQSLVRLYGESYERYRRRVPRFIPRLWPL